MEGESAINPEEIPRQTNSDDELESEYDSSEEMLLGDHNFDQKRLDTKCLLWIIKDERPFGVVESPGFKELMNELQPKYKVPTRKDIAIGVWDMFLSEKAKIKSMIGNSRVSITIDTWTSIQDFSYMAVTVHFLDNEWTLHKKIINFAMVTSDEEDRIGRVLERCLNDWGIKKVFTIAVNDVSVTDEMIDSMNKWHKTRGALVLDGIYLHVKCALNIINMIVEDGMKDLYSSIEGIRNCVRFIHSSSDWLKMFRNVVSLENMDKMATIPLDDVTRWNKTYCMLSSAFKYKNVFGRMAKENDEFEEYFEELASTEIDGDIFEAKREGPPVEEDWEIAMSFAYFLKKFYNATTKLMATRTPTSNLILETMVALQVEIEHKVRDSQNPSLQRMAHFIKLKIDKYWGSIDDVNLNIFVAQVLDPRYKLDMIDIYMETLEVEVQKIDQFKESIKEHLNELVKAYKVEIEEERRREVQVDDVSMVQKDEDEDVKVMFHRQLMNKRKCMEISNEVDKYLNDPFESPYDDGFDLLKWWKSNSSRYPVLSKIARDVFALPTSTVAIEKTFSIGKKALSPFRSSLTPKTLEALVCISNWLRDEKDIQIYKEDTEEEEVAVYEELEKINKDVSKVDLEDMET